MLVRTIYMYLYYIHMCLIYLLALYTWIWATNFQQFINISLNNGNVFKYVWSMYKHCIYR